MLEIHYILAHTPILLAYATYSNFRDTRDAPSPSPSINIWSHQRVDYTSQIFEDVLVCVQVA